MYIGCSIQNRISVYAAVNLKRK